MLRCNMSTDNRSAHLWERSSSSNPLGSIDKGTEIDCSYLGITDELHQVIYYNDGPSLSFHTAVIQGSDEQRYEHGKCGSSYFCYERRR